MNGHSERCGTDERSALADGRQVARTAPDASIFARGAIADWLLGTDNHQRRS
jgi:hypothetical protein